MASLRLNIPVIFVSGGPMEAGKTKLSDKIIKLDLVDAMIQGQTRMSAMPTASRLSAPLAQPAVPVPGCLPPTR